MKKAMLAFASVALAFASTVPAHAFAGAAVTLTFSVGEPATTAAVFATCHVSVPAGSNGIAMLNAAVSTGCINSYDTLKDPTYGDFLLAVDHIRGAHEASDVTYWRTTVNGAGATVGIDGYHAALGDVYGFSYTTWLGCLTPLPLC
ncbi:MAG: hypothetical protein ACYDCC_10770 [Actinomycetota bacterium]